MDLSDGIRVQDRVYVEYHGETFLHERCSVPISDHKHVCILSLHMDMYVEPIASYAAVYVSGPRQGILPSGGTQSLNRKWVRFDLAALAVDVLKISWGCGDVEPFCGS